MADTHINAFHGLVAEKKLALDQAQGEYESAVEALKNHPDYEEPSAPEEDAEEEVEQAEEESTKVKVSKRK